MVNIASVPKYAGNTLLVLWETLKGDTTDIGTPILSFDHSDVSIQVVGNWGVGGSINMEGSNDNVNWHILTDPQGNVITKTADFLEQVTEICKYYRVQVTAGDSATDLDAYLFLRRQR